MSIVMYGQSPDLFPPNWPNTFPPPNPAAQPWPIQPGVTVVTQGRTADQETSESIKRKLTERIAWLERELSMHEAWKTELATLRRVLEAYESPELPGGAEGEKR